jgi:hypothetical protein
MSYSDKRKDTMNPVNSKEDYYSKKCYRKTTSWDKIVWRLLYYHNNPMYKHPSYERNYKGDSVYWNLFCDA